MLLAARDELKAFLFPCVSEADVVYQLFMHWGVMFIYNKQTHHFLILSADPFQSFHFVPEDIVLYFKSVTKKNKTSMPMIYYTAL